MILLEWSQKVSIFYWTTPEWIGTSNNPDFLLLLILLQNFLECIHLSWMYLCSFGLHFTYTANISIIFQAHIQLTFLSQILSFECDLVVKIPLKMYFLQLSLMLPFLNVDLLIQWDIELCLVLWDKSNFLLHRHVWLFNKYR